MAATGLLSPFPPPGLSQSTGALSPRGARAVRAVPESEEDRLVGRVPAGGGGRLLSVSAHAVQGEGAAVPCVSALVSGGGGEEGVVSWRGGLPWDPPAVLRRLGLPGGGEALLALLERGRAAAGRRALALSLVPLLDGVSAEDARAALDEAIVRSVQEP